MSSLAYYLWAYFSLACRIKSYIPCIYWEYYVNDLSHLQDHYFILSMLISLAWKNSDHNSCGLWTLTNYQKKKKIIKNNYKSTKKRIEIITCHGNGLKRYTHGLQNRNSLTLPIIIWRDTTTIKCQNAYVSSSDTFIWFQNIQFTRDVDTTLLSSISWVSCDSGKMWDVRLHFGDFGLDLLDH